MDRRSSLHCDKAVAAAVADAAAPVVGSAIFRAPIMWSTDRHWPLLKSQATLREDLVIQRRRSICNHKHGRLLVYSRVVVVVVAVAAVLASSQICQRRSVSHRQRHITSVLTLGGCSSVVAAVVAVPVTPERRPKRCVIRCSMPVAYTKRKRFRAQPAGDRNCHRELLSSMENYRE